MNPIKISLQFSQLSELDLVAKQLLEIVEKAEIDHTASYLDWQGKTIDW